MSLLWQGYVRRQPSLPENNISTFNLVYKPSPGLHQAFIGLYIRHGISLLQCQKELGVWHSVWISPLQESRGISTFYTPVSRVGVHEPCPLGPPPAPLVVYQHSTIARVTYVLQATSAPAVVGTWHSWGVYLPLSENAIFGLLPPDLISLGIWAQILKVGIVPWVPGRDPKWKKVMRHKNSGCSGTKKGIEPQLVIIALFCICSISICTWCWYGRGPKLGHVIILSQNYWLQSICGIKKHRNRAQTCHNRSHLRF